MQIASAHIRGRSVAVQLPAEVELAVLSCGRREEVGRERRCRRKKYRFLPMQVACEFMVTGIRGSAVVLGELHS
jgi:predicted methyltransferase MtxX (methanogen marker protein 4)